MAHARRFTQRTSSSRRKTTWNAGPSQNAVATISAAGSLLWDTGSAVALGGTTQVRLWGQYTLMLNVVTAIGDGFASYGLGICNVTAEAFAVGVTAIPSPITDIDWDGWLWHQLGGQLRGASTTELGVSPMEAVRGEIDSKAMRKLRITDVTVGVLELGTEQGAATVVFTARTRVFDKL